ncbi:tyrosine-type recombinase/integrase [Coraliomargarita sp. W4R53]
MPNTATQRTTVATALEIEAAVSHGKTADYRGHGILITARKFKTAKGMNSSLLITIPAKITGDKRLRKHAKTATEAASWIERWLTGHTTAEATASEQRAFLSALPQLRELDVSIDTLIKHYTGTFVEAGNRMTLSQLHADVMGLLESRSISERQRRSNEGYGRRIVEDFKDCEVHIITAARAYKWVTEAETKEKKWGAKTRSHHWNWLNRLLNRAASKKAIPVNPLQSLGEEEQADISRKTYSTPEILTKKEAEQVLATIKAIAPNLLGAAILQLFAGLRTAEARRIEWKDINFDDGLVNVSEEVAKTNDTRNVELNDTCREWLSTVPQTGPKVCNLTENQGNKKWRKVSDNLPYDWKHNAMRHSFASYTLVLKDENYTKEQLGHSERSRTLFKHYRSAATTKAAKAYFSIKPEQTKDAVIPFKAKSA